MPTYSYHCAKCKKDFECVQKITDPQLDRCPVCKNKKIKRLISKNINFILKGSGWTPKHYK